MPLVWVDGFEDAGALTVNGTGQSIGAARTANGMVVTQTGGGWDLPILSADIFTIGLAMKMANFGTGNTAFFLQFYDSVNATRLGITAMAGQLLAVRGVTTVLTSSTCLLVNTWHYVEMQVRLHDTLGSVTFRCDGVPVGTVSGVDTNQTVGGTTVNTLRFTASGSGTTLYDDFVLQTGSLSDPFYGDVAVETLLPNGNGAASTWVGSDGNSTDNYLLVDDMPPSSTDYVTSGVVGAQDLYTFSDLSVNATSVIAVCPTFQCSKTDAGARTITPIVRRTATNAGSPLTAIQVSPTYTMKQGYFMTDPETGALWTPANVNALQAGMQVS